LEASRVFAESGRSAFAEVPNVPDDAPSDEIYFARCLRVIERAGVLLVGLGFFGIIALAATPRALQSRIRSTLAARTAASAVPDERTSIPSRSELRYRYPYSVIPGGASSVEMLRDAIGTDRTVSAHFADFDFTRARVVTLDRDAAFYASYRLDSGVFWTTERILLRRGELLLTDGASFVRTRTGSRLSAVPLLPVSSLEPTAAEMDAVQAGGFPGQ
jgi:hypothetical protein